jgi:hypothetical protein
MMWCGGRHYKAMFESWKSQQRLGVLQGERGPQAWMGGGGWDGMGWDGMGGKVWGFGDGRNEGH